MLMELQQSYSDQKFFTERLVRTAGTAFAPGNTWARGSLQRARWSPAPPRSTALRSRLIRSLTIVPHSVLLD